MVPDPAQRMAGPVTPMAPVKAGAKAPEAAGAGKPTEGATLTCRFSSEPGSSRSESASTFHMAQHRRPP